MGYYTYYTAVSNQNARTYFWHANIVNPNTIKPW